MHRWFVEYSDLHLIYNNVLRFTVMLALIFHLQQVYFSLYYMEENVSLGTKPLVDSIRHFILDPSGVFSVCHLSECRIVQ